MFVNQKDFDDFMIDLNNLASKYNIYMRGYDGDIIIENIEDGIEEGIVYWNAKDKKFHILRSEVDSHYYFI